MQTLLCLCLFVTASALVTPASSNCIVGCKCEEETNFSRKLKILDCDSPLDVNPDALKDISKKLTIIVFKHVVIKKIEKDAFKAFNDLEMVMIEDTTIGAIDPSAFEVPELGVISFKSTTFGEVPNLKSDYLEELLFNDCKLTQVPKLDDLHSLSFLNLANNKIKNIDESTFVNSVNLEEVTLSNNSISKLPVNLFINNSNLNTLNVDYNPLESFQLNLTSDLELLSLKSCRLTTFDRNSAKTLDSLSMLILSGNQISVLPIDAFDVMEDLNNIDLSNNKLVELDDNIFYKNSKLDRITLNNNNFETLPNFQTQTKFFQTKRFFCKNCNLKTLSNVFENMKGLVSIDLSNNKLTNVDGVFSGMQELRELNLSYNNISTVTVNSFGSKKALEVLDLSHNPLQPLDPVVFARMLAMKTLDVSNSTLTKLWTNHNAVLPALEALLIGNNNMSVISTEDLQLAPKLKSINLQENPLNCSVQLRDLIKYLQNKPIYSITKSDLLKTHEEMTISTGEEAKQDSSWRQLDLGCSTDEDNILDNDDIDDEDHYYTEAGEDDEDEEDIDDEDDDVNKDNDLFVMDASVLDERNLSLAKASWILSITSVFILTALVVLTVAVAITLLILKRNKAFNMNNDNMPRLKIPLWNATPSHKRHSGSIYKPLSEDYSGPRTPIINRYEFKQTPQVHNSFP